MARTRRTPYLFALALAAAIGTACAVGPIDGAGPSASPDTSAPTAAPTQTAREDGTMTEAEFQDDLRGAVDVAERYWSAQFQAAGRQFSPVSEIIPYHSSGEVTCAGEPVPANNALYCSAGDFIAYDVDWAVAAFRKIGDAFLYYLLSHEYSHGIQVRLGESFRFTVQQELQADCMAGANIGDSVRDGDLDLQSGDLDELRTGLVAVGDDPDQPWFAEGSHGSPEQRTKSFFDGYDQSLGACGLN